MDEKILPWNLHSVKQWAELVVAFAGGCVIVAAAAAYCWAHFAQPAIHETIEEATKDRFSVIETRILAANSGTVENSAEVAAVDARMAKLEREYNAVLDDASRSRLLVDHVQKLIATQVRSISFLSKGYHIGDHRDGQDALGGWFYATPVDHVTLSIFTAGRQQPDINVSINGGNEITIKDVAASPQHLNNWRDVDISGYVSVPLADMQYIGLPSNVNSIQVIPRPVSMRTGDHFDLVVIVAVSQNQ